MPKETFINLKPEKKEQIELAALHEFAQYGLAEASVSRIIKEARISTGSFYQYFEDIKDLFVYVYTKFGNMKTACMQEEIDALTDDSFENVIRAMYRGGIRFATQNSLANKMFSGATQIKDAAVLQDIMELMPQMEVTQWFYGIIQKAMDKGELRSDIPLDLFFSLFININLAVIEYVVNKSEAADGIFTREDLDLFCDLAVSIVLDGLR